MKRRILSLAMVLAMLSLLAMPMAALAETSVVSGTVGTYYSLSVPQAVNLGEMNYQGSKASAAQTVIAATNLATKTAATVTVLGSNSGMLTGIDSALTLAGNGFASITLSGSAQPLVTVGTLGTVGIEKTWTLTTLVITQPPFTSVAAGTYSCTLTFTATFTP